MFTHTFYVEKHLFLHIGKEVRLIERIGHAREHEVLPDHDAVAVAKFQQSVGGVVAAAPHAQHVEVALRCGAHVIFQLFLVRAGVKAVEGDEVRALAEHSFTVDHESEVAAILVRAPVQLHRAQTYRPALFAHSALPALKPHFQRVEGLGFPLRHTVGPPKLRVFHRETECELVRIHSLRRPLRAVGGAQHRFRRDLRPVVQPRRGHIRAQGHRAAVMLLQDRDLGDLRIAAVVDVDVAGNAARRKHGTPIPSEMALRLSYAVYAVYAVGVGGSAVELALLRDVLHGRGDDDLDLIAPRVQELLDVELVRDVAVVRIRHRLAVDQHRGKGVQPLAHQHRPVRFEILLADVEVAEPAPIPLRHPKEILLVGAFEGIGYRAVSHEIEVVAGRDVRRIFHVVGHVFEYPSAVKIRHKTSARRGRARKTLSSQQMITFFALFFKRKNNDQPI